MSKADPTIFISFTHYDILWKPSTNNISVSQVTVFAGNCTESGKDTGRRLTARFAYPSGLSLSPDETTLYIADRQVCTPLPGTS